MKLFKRFLYYYRPYRWLFLADMLCVIIASAIDLLFPQLLNLLTKDVFQREPAEIMKVIVWIGLGLLGLYLIRYFCMYFTTCWGHIMGARMETDMRRDLFQHYQRLSFSYYDKNNTGEMMSRIVSDLFDITELCHHGPEMLLISSIKIIGSFAILLTINWKMTLILLAVTLCIIVFSAFQRKKCGMYLRTTERKLQLLIPGSRIHSAGSVW